MHKLYIQPIFENYHHTLPSHQLLYEALYAARSMAPSGMDNGYLSGVLINSLMKELGKLNFVIIGSSTDY